MRVPGARDVTRAAVDAVRDLSKCQHFFKNLEKNESWRGWENWLTVEIVRRLDHSSVTRFGRYSSGSARADIVVTGSPLMMVEVKVNYIERREIERWRKENEFRLPTRIVKDIQKLQKMGRRKKRLLIVATAFEPGVGPREYTRRVEEWSRARWRRWRIRWLAAGSYQVMTMYGA